jgi:hypothetical protein
MKATDVATGLPGHPTHPPLTDAGGTVVYVHGMRVLNLVDEPAHRAVAPSPRPRRSAPRRAATIERNMVASRATEPGSG